MCRTLFAFQDMQILTFSIIGFSILKAIFKQDLFC